MGVTRAMQDKRSEYGVPMQDAAEQMQDAADLVSRQDRTTEEVLPQPLVHRKRTAVPISEKALLTLEEAAEYTGLGLQKLRDISNSDTCDFVLWNGTKRMFKRKKLETYLAAAYSI